MLYRDHGDRFDRSMARLKVVVERLGIDECREIVEGFLDAEGVDHGDFEKEFVEDCGPAVPPRPLAEAQPRATTARPSPGSWCPRARSTSTRSNASPS